MSPPRKSSIRFITFDTHHGFDSQQQNETASARDDRLDIGGIAQASDGMQNPARNSQAKPKAHRWRGAVHGEKSRAALLSIRTLEPCLLISNPRSAAQPTHPAVRQSPAFGKTPAPRYISKRGRLRAQNTILKECLQH